MHAYAAVSDTLLVDAVLVEGVGAQEVHSRELKLLLAVVADLLVESSRCRFHPADLALHAVDALHVLVHLVVVLLDRFDLRLEFVDEEFLEDFKSQLLIVGLLFVEVQTASFLLVALAFGFVLCV